MTVVRKILEGILTTGNTTISFTDALIPNSILKVTTTNSNVFPLSQTLSSNTLQLTFEAQTSNLGVSLEIIKQGLDIVDDVISSDADKALSAKQGKVLKDAIDAIVIPDVINSLESASTTDALSAYQGKLLNDDLQEVFTSVSNGKELIADAITDKGVETSATDTFATMASNILDIPSGGGGGTGVANSLNQRTGVYTNQTITLTLPSSGNYEVYGMVSSYGNASWSIKQNNTALTVSVVQQFSGGVSYSFKKDVLIKSATFSGTAGDIITVTMSCDYSIMFAVAIPVNV